tara:strand:- start:2161 stop:2763 length:603 start_codon:yes stop_codon:yes gene_type:complete
MPLNIPRGSTDNISFGPARVFMKKWAKYTIGANITPDMTDTDASNDVGFIGEDGVTVELTSEKKDINQGNPKLVNYSFVMSQSASIKFSSIAWNFENFALALGAGTTTADSAEETFAFGGNPLNTETAMIVRHQMAVTGDTLFLYVWKAQAESGFSIPFGADEHSFEFSFKAIRAIEDWGGTALGTDEQLIRFKREIYPT